MINSKSKQIAHWFGCGLDKLPHSTGKILFQYFHVQDRGENIYELTDPAIRNAFFYCKGHEQYNILQPAVSMCTNLKKQLIIITLDGNAAISKQYSTDNINVITAEELQNKHTLKHIFALFKAPPSLDTSSPPPTENRQVTLNSNINDAVQYIDTNLTEKLSIQEFAAHMNYSVSYFSKQFHQQVGISFQDYVINKRIELAKALLQQPEKIASVAYQCGYRDISYFSRIFKKRTGMTPQQYRDTPSRDE